MIVPALGMPLYLSLFLWLLWTARTVARKLGLTGYRIYALAIRENFIALPPDFQPATGQRLMEYALPA